MLEDASLSLKNQKLSDETIDKIIEVFDENHDGKISLYEFNRIVLGGKEYKQCHEEHKKSKEKKRIDVVPDTEKGHTQNAYCGSYIFNAPVVMNIIYTDNYNIIEDQSNKSNDNVGSPNSLSPNSCNVNLEHHGDKSHDKNKLDSYSDIKSEELAVKNFQINEFISERSCQELPNPQVRKACCCSFFKKKNNRVQAIDGYDLYNNTGRKDGKEQSRPVQGEPILTEFNDITNMNDKSLISVAKLDNKSFNSHLKKKAIDPKNQLQV